MTGLLVTGTGTDVGKTVVTAAVTALAVRAGRSVTVLKPAQTGVAPGGPGDLADVDRLAGGADLVELARYPDPLSPAAAARRSGLPPLTLDACAHAVAGARGRADLVLVEGAGGLLVRLDDAGLTLADLAAEAALPVLVVAAAGLGTLNAVALTLEALATRGLPLAGLVLGRWPAEPGLAERCNVADLEDLAGGPLLGALPDGAGQLDRAAFLDVARTGLAPALGGQFDAAAFARAVT